MPNELDQKGLDVRAQLWGEESLQTGNQYLRNFDEQFASFLNDQLFAGIWSRPGLPMQSRSLITMAALMALGRSPELKLHMTGALNIGVSPEEIKELIIHVSQYSGLPTAMEAIRIYNEVAEKGSGLSVWSQRS
jgi:4-carboxymuconolactone decarboxylase